MNKQEAKELLMLYRPGTADEQDPDFAEALNLAGEEPELREWFDEHCALQQAIRAKFRSIEVPEGLKEQIISERPRPKRAVAPRVALMAAAVLMVVVVVSLAKVYLGSGEDKTLAGLTYRMAKTVRSYPVMDLETNNLHAIERFLAINGHSGIELPKPLEKTATTGCALLHWQNKPVAMICFNSGRNPQDADPDLYLFVASASDVPGSPEPGAPKFDTAANNKLLTATWTAGEKTYILMARGEANFLQNYF